MNDITEIGYTCNIKKCKSVSAETGRFISELTLKTLSQPVPTITDKDIDKLGKYLDILAQSCGITDEHSKNMNKYYNEIYNIYSSARGPRLAAPLSDILDTIDYANTKCSCK